MRKTLTVDGMTCGHCEETVEAAAVEVDGVASASADRETGSVAIEGTADVATVVDAVTEAGYDASAD